MNLVPLIVLLLTGVQSDIVEAKEFATMSTLDATVLPVEDIANRLLLQKNQKIRSVIRPSGLSSQHELRRLTLISEAVPSNIPQLCQAPIYQIEFLGSGDNNIDPRSVKMKVSSIKTDTEFKFIRKSVESQTQKQCSSINVGGLFNVESTGDKSSAIKIVYSMVLNLGNKNRVCISKINDRQTCNMSDYVSVTLYNLASISETVGTEGRDSSCLTARFAPDGVDSGWAAKMLICGLTKSSNGIFSLEPRHKVSLQSGLIGVE